MLEANFLKMGRKKDLLEEEKEQIVKELVNGKDTNEISKNSSNCSKVCKYR